MCPENAGGGGPRGGPRVRGGRPPRMGGGARQRPETVAHLGGAAAGGASSPRPRPGPLPSRHLHGSKLHKGKRLDRLADARGGHQAARHDLAVGREQRRQLRLGRLVGQVADVEVAVARAAVCGRRRGVGGASARGGGERGAAAGCARSGGGVVRAREGQSLGAGCCWRPVGDGVIKGRGLTGRV